MAGQDLAQVVTRASTETWTQTEWKLGQGYGEQTAPRFHVVAYDFGVKNNILRMLAERGCKVTVVPAKTSARDALALKPDGIFLSNGPGDPEPCDYAITATRELIDSGIPTFGICLGHQILALASGAQTFKMKFGHHGANHPVRTSTPAVSASPARTTVLRWTRPACPPHCGPRTSACLTARCRALPALTSRPSASRATPKPARPARHRLPVRPLHRPDGQGLKRTDPMPKRTDIQSILIIGAGPIIISQACGSTTPAPRPARRCAKRATKVILVNSNPATIMTDPDTPDVTYIEPITWQVVEKIIAKERPDAVLPTMGGQTALNCALDLHRNGVLAKYGVAMIGANEHAIEKAEDRLKFKDAMTKIGLDSAKSGIAHSLEEAWAVQKAIQAEIGGSGFPMVIRPSFTLGGTGGGIAYNPEEFETICKRGLDLSPTNELLIEESLIGWKEYEMEVVRDKADNCIIVCSIENLDPMGVHTGDSITVAPSQTLSDKEYQLLRNASLAVLREIGVDTGGSNVQFSINPKNGRMIVIEMNPRVSRSSALASKATGFPIAKVAAKLAVGYTLDELKNDITGGATPASFEPSIDYVVTKIPRFAFEKFPMADARLTATQMKSVGEVMAMGRTFQSPSRRRCAAWKPASTA